MSSKILIILVIVCIWFSCLLFINHMASAGDMSDVNALIDKAEKQQITVPQIKDNPNAKETVKVFSSKEYQKRLHEQINTLKSQLYPDPKSSNPTPISRKENHQNAFLMPDERIYLFVSSSMPISTLKTYAADLDKLKDPNIIMVMRGFVGGVQHMKPTLEFIDSVLTKDPNCDSLRKKCDAYHIGINIDPLLFSRYDIRSVPAIMYARGISLTDPETNQDSKADTTLDAYMVSGDVSFEYALDVIEKKSKSSQIQNILKKLRRGFY